ncbi:phosphotransferase [Actinocorallia sp. API 0066]|uniref:phosphotransferase n=1 Tax=Actinocorallia sp. API 0066 TaxID=2896846 RepID=UPI001E3FD495|nr:phosphotransferase [Actinocorallia sp. API 0066]MCD0449812.1 phosphotransferase [Actinocorallia sp. API 0066]
MIGLDDLREPLDLAIHSSAGRLWPGAGVEMGELAPSVTSYVRPVRVTGLAPMYAKVSVLGSSLVSVLRGVHGDAVRVAAALPVYLAEADCLVAREAAQLRALARVGVPVCEVAGQAGGVLFTRAVDGPTLADLVEVSPDAAGDRLLAVTAELSRLPRVASALGPVAIPERDIVAIFARKFDRGGAREYLAATGHGAVLEPVVAQLVALRGVLYEEPRVLQYGDLKPEHVFFPHGFAARPVFVDPGVMAAHPWSDLARLTSRIGLLAMAGRAPARVRGVMVDELVAHLHSFGPSDSDGVRDLVLLWLMDTVNILTTYCTAPEGLPVGRHAVEVRAAAEVVCGFLAEATAELPVRQQSRVLFARVVAALAGAAR